MSRHQTLLKKNGRFQGMSVPLEMASGFSITRETDDAWREPADVYWPPMWIVSSHVTKSVSTKTDRERRTSFPRFCFLSFLSLLWTRRSNQKPSFESDFQWRLLIGSASSKELRCAVRGSLALRLSTSLFASRSFVSEKTLGSRAVFTQRIPSGVKIHVERIL